MKSSRSHAQRAPVGEDAPVNLNRARSVVLWDVDGTLVDYAVPLATFVDQCLAGVGIDPESISEAAVQEAEDRRLSLEGAWRTLDDEEAGFREVARVLLAGTGATEEQIAQCGTAFARYFDLYAPIEGIEALLAELKARGVPQGVVSNWPPSLKEFLRYHGLAQYFQVIVGSGEEGVAKPDLELFRRALAALGARPEECIYVGDNPNNDVVPSRVLGIYPIHFNPRRDRERWDVCDVPALRARLWTALGS